MLAEIANGSVIVGVSLIALVALITIVAIIRYDVDAVLKIWGALGTLLGLVVGTMGTYFFTKDQVEQKDSQVRFAQTALESTQKEKAALGGKVQDLSHQVAALEANKSDLQSQLFSEQVDAPGAAANRPATPAKKATEPPRKKP